MWRCLIFLLFAPLVAEEEIVVHVQTQRQLLPVCLTWQGRQEELKRVLAFDLQQSGVMKLAEKAAYKVEVKADSEKLSVRALAGDYVRGTFEVPLNRASVHQLADAIQKALFGTEGIAQTRILYTVKTGEIAEVWCADYDGGNAQKVTRDGQLTVTPTFLPPLDGTSAGACFYVSYQTGQPKIYIRNLGSGPAQRLTYLRGNQLMPAVSKDRTQVAFVSDAAGNPDLFLQEFRPEVGAIGKPRHIFHAPNSAQGSPTFSPDGKQIAFVSNKDGTPRIYVMDVPPDGVKSTDVKVQMLTKNTRDNTCPAWSPDGTKIAYTAKKDGVRQIWIYDLVKGEEWQLTEGPGHKENPCWAPDSMHLIFNTTELYLINLNHPQAVKITSGPGEKRFPAWAR